MGACCVARKEMGRETFDRSIHEQHEEAKKEEMAQQWLNHGWAGVLLLLCFFFAQAKIHCNTSSHNCCKLAHGGGANTSRHTRQAQAQSWVTHESTNKQTVNRHTRHKKTNKQQADIQDTGGTTTDTRMHMGIQDTRRQDRFKKTTAYTRMHWGNNRQHKHCNKIAYIDVHACKQTYMFTSCP